MNDGNGIAARSRASRWPNRIRLLAPQSGNAAADVVFHLVALSIIACSPVDAPVAKVLPVEPMDDLRTGNLLRNPEFRSCWQRVMRSRMVGRPVWTGELSGQCAPRLPPDPAKAWV
ncbi:hypothetical protein NDR87_36355 [Nocardia sp. CDC159]|uniref:Uncharacterized protein n=1 Tax=Nocardia pulmonis TaxID=2951408 RepID=A0A9X2J3C6_9NOCA|nr:MULTISPECIES: hypothetical protein [Nocardia]MCM6778961.1 hypothetical protein [Nocardia pulmonis]MCM6791850.1 hypothetical protein [Nocardia sp. CDC159]